MRTLLFLLGWSLLLSVVQALMLQRQHSLWFVLATLIYLVSIQIGVWRGYRSRDYAHNRIWAAPVIAAKSFKN